MDYMGNLSYFSIKLTIQFSPMKLFMPTTEFLMAKAHPFEMYSKRDWKLRKQWRWRIRANNGKIIAASSEGYFNKMDCRYNAMSTGRSLLAAFSEYKPEDD